MKSRKAFMLLVVLLWIVAGITLIVNLNKDDEEAVVATFGQIDCERMQSRFFTDGILESDYLTRNEQVELLEDIAEQIGITGNYEIVDGKDGNSRSVELEKKSDCAQVAMKIITYEVEVEDNVIETRQYFSMDLYLYKYIEEIVILKQEIDKVLNDYPFECNAGLEFEAEFEGELSLAEKNHLSKWYLDEIDAQTISSEKDSSIYTIYAYTDYIRDYQIIDGNAVNVNLAFNYDEEQNITHFFMATPYLQGEY